MILPTGAQGLNLGLGDAATIAELAVAARRGPRCLRSAAFYVVSRSEDIDLKKCSACW